MRDEITKNAEIRCRMVNEVPSGDYAVGFRQAFVCTAADPQISKTEPPEYSLTTKLAFSLHGITLSLFYIMLFQKRLFRKAHTRTWNFPFIQAK